MALMRRERTGDWPGRFRWPEMWWPRMFSDEDYLRVEEFTDDGTLVVRAEMPGIDPDKDVEISVADHMLTIRAERHEESTGEEKGHYHSEFRYGEFSRTVPLPAGASEEDVKASYNDGILEVRVPCSEPAPQAKKIPIAKT